MEKTTELTLYVDIAELKVGEKITLEFSTATATTSFKGKFSADELNGPFAEGKNFALKPLVDVSKAKGPVKVKTGEIGTLLPEKGRAARRPNSWAPVRLTRIECLQIGKASFVPD
jgi:hypothetical protein